ncbi:hypothetical protein [Nocardioides sp. KR10-350]|uniref:hypothetical protein n=1 Tax=Nocardioides cheoyonin TaxID=3156615 RepID=UPI0032B34EFF
MDPRTPPHDIPDQTDQQAARPRRSARARARLVVRYAVGVLLVLAPFAGALTAITYAPPAHLEVVGQDVTVKPVLGQDTTQLQSGAIIRPEHATIPVLGKDIGLDVEADWNQLIPQDKRTRAYLTQLWDDPAPEMARIRSAAEQYLVRWTVVGFGAVLLLELGTWAGLRQRRLKLASYVEDEAALVAGHNRRLRVVSAVVALAAVAALDVVAVHSYAHDDQRTVVGSPVFAGTSLAGTEVDGLIGEIVPFLSMIEPRNEFYDRVSDNLDDALEKTPLEAGKDEVLFIAGEDLEDVNGMARILGRAADLTDADFLAYTGDLTFGGKAIESYLIDTIDYYSGGVPVEFAPGLHDTDTIVQAAKARGWRVADGKTHEIAGIDVLTAADPRISDVGDFGAGVRLRDPDVDEDEFVSDVGEEACATEPDFVLLHDHLLGKRIAEQGCTSAAVVDGRSYELVGPRTVTTVRGETAVEFTSGSAGGHTTTAPNPGTISSAATFEAFLYDTKTGETRYSVFTVRPDASVTVTPPISIDVPYQDFLDDGRTEANP